MGDSKNDEVITEKIINAAKKNPKGISAKDIAAAVPELSSAELVNAINKFLQQGLFDLFNQSGTLIYKLVDIFY